MPALARGAPPFGARVSRVLTYVRSAFALIGGDLLFMRATGFGGQFIVNVSTMDLVVVARTDYLRLYSRPSLLRRGAGVQGSTRDSGDLKSSPPPV